MLKGFEEPPLPCKGDFISVSYDELRIHEGIQILGGYLTTQPRSKIPHEEIRRCVHGMSEQFVTHPQIRSTP